MLAPLLLGLQLATSAASPAAAVPVPPLLVDALLSKDEPTWREAALRLSLAGPGAVKAVAARDGEKLKASHRAVQTFLMLALLQSVTAQDLRASPALQNFWEPSVAETRQLLQRPIPFRRPGARQNPARTENQTPEQKAAAENARAQKRMQGFLVPIILERLLAATDPTVRLDAVLALERLRAWSAASEVEKIAADPTLAADHVLAKTARRFLDAHRKAKADPHAAATGLEPRLASMVAFEEAAEPDALWKGLQQAVPAALEAKSADQFWSLARGTFAGFWRAAAASPPEARAAALARWSDRTRGYSMTVTPSERPLRISLTGPAGARASILDAGTGKPVKEGKLPLVLAAAPPAGVRVVGQLAGRKVEIYPEPRATGTVSIELLELPRR